MKKNIYCSNCFNLTKNTQTINMIVHRDMTKLKAINYFKKMCNTRRHSNTEFRDEKRFIFHLIWNFAVQQFLTHHCTATKMATEASQEQSKVCTPDLLLHFASATPAQNLFPLFLTRSPSFCLDCPQFFPYNLMMGCHSVNDGRCLRKH